MKSRRILYGMMGLLSLLGLIGLFTESKAFLSFFAFAVNFEYFFVQSDEMLEEYMDRSASRAFYCGMIAMALVSLGAFFLASQKENKALITGLAWGWIVSVVVYALSAAYYGFKERRGLECDQK